MSNLSVIRPISDLSFSSSDCRLFSSSFDFQPLLFRAFEFVRLPTVLEFVRFLTFLVARLWVRPIFDRSRVFSISNLISVRPIFYRSRVRSILSTKWMTSILPSVDVEALLDPLPMMHSLNLFLPILPSSVISKKIPFLAHKHEYVWFWFISMSMLVYGT